MMRMLDIGQQKQQLRQKMRECRRALSPETRQAHSRMACENLLSAYPWQTNRRVAITQPFDGEISLLPAVNQLLALGVSLYLPVLQTGKTLRFSPYHAYSRLHANALGIDEPTDQQECLFIDAMDVVILPLVAFDDQGHRLGMGGGYYDASIAQASRRPYLIGMGYACQQVAHLVTEPWDIPLDLVVTEQFTHQLPVLAH